VLLEKYLKVIGIRFSRRKKIKKRNPKMTRVVVNGSFDIIHLGHIRLLEYARSFEDSFVYVLIDSDRRIRELKGATRPVNTHYERAALLGALRFVDRVDIFDSDEELDTYLKEYAPDIMVKGSDYVGRRIIGAQHCKEIKFYDVLDGYSTTRKIQSIADR
jgi:rfaE bifunctional protein nucleotidyltransferase chain/domain